jgi:hypothetical protein
MVLVLQGTWLKVHIWPTTAYFHSISFAMVFVCYQDSILLEITQFGQLVVRCGDAALKIRVHAIGCAPLRAVFKFLSFFLVVTPRVA